MSLKFKAKQMGIYHTSTPVFNKRLFKAQAGIVLTEEILKILNRHHDQERSKSELYKLKSIVNGLKDVHKGFQFIKDALSIVICYEKIEANVNVKKQPTEKGLSCYYILTGSIEATYDINDSDSDEERKVIGFASLREESKNNKIQNDDGSYIISYTHVAGDYLGLVSGEGPEYDLPPPKFIKTLETCEFLRIDRGKFHHAVRVVHNQYVQEVENFINSESILRHLPEKEREKLVPLMAKQDYAAGKVIVNQGAVPDHIFFIGKGRCQFFRRIFIKEAHRVELVKLGQIEKGDVFGESSLLDGSPCFCSVASIGQVTCFLINKWVIKTSENVLNLLRHHAHIFYEDDIIKHYIRDSDIWQSYKRSQVIELLKSMNRQFFSLNNQDIEEILERSLEFGDAKRSLSSRTSTQREVGEPEHNEPLFVVPRSRRPSSAILHSNATAVVKAVLLLQRKHGESDIQLPPLEADPQRIKPVSAPCRYRSANHRRSEQQISIENGNQHRPKSTSDSRKNTRNSKFNRGKRMNGLCSESQRPQHSSCQNDKMRNKSRIKEGVISPSKEVKCQVRGTNNHSLDSPDTERDKGMTNDEEESKDATRVEKYFSSSKNFIIKEIINTGNPKRKTSPYRYRRFDQSMFSILDGEENDEVNRRTAPSPWRVSFVASKWMSGIRRKRLEAAAERNGNVTPSPTPPPLIVIEEYAPQLGINDESPSVHSSDEKFNTKKSSAKPSRTPTPSLEQLDEENDDDINEYNKHEAGKPIEEKWYTPIHQARDESRLFLKQLQVDIDELKKHRRKNIHAAPDKETKTLSEDLDNGCEKEPYDREKIKVKKESGAMEGRTILSSRSRNSARMDKNNIYNSSGKSKNLLIFDEKKAGLSHTGTPPKTRHERRRLLLLSKIDRN